MDCSGALNLSAFDFIRQKTEMFGIKLLLWVDKRK